MKIAFDVDVTKDLGLTRMVQQAADCGYQYVEPSPHPQNNPFYKHPKAGHDIMAEYKNVLKATGVEMGVRVINTKLAGNPNEPEVCEEQWYKSMEELLPIIERERIRVEIQSHP
ncbi:hypothetical protein ACQKDS_12735 [Serratia sp. NPDC078593]|uniref:hypothetical protein n=1 Tax=unclassified Serratia (in: enterobacteria) TaxID=2647522 RepID=UPI0037D58CFB